MAAYKNKKWTPKRMNRKRIAEKGVNSKGNAYTVYTDGSYRYDNSDGYHYNNSDGSTYTRRGDHEHYKAPNGRNGWIRTHY